MRRCGGVTASLARHAAGADCQSGVPAGRLIGEASGTVAGNAAEKASTAGTQAAQLPGGMDAKRCCRWACS
jgi:hypothetical protein